MNVFSRQLLLIVFISRVVLSAEITFTETFAEGGNEGNWTLGTANTYISSKGGNPGAFLHDPKIVTFAPMAETVGKSWFSSDFRKRRVVRASADLLILDIENPEPGVEWPVSIILWQDNGTPTNPKDDWAAYFVGTAGLTLEAGKKWKTFTFEIPSNSVTLPDRWQILLNGPESPQKPDWERLITDVASLAFYIGDPDLFALYQTWNVGVDNVSITLNQSSK